MAFAPALVPVNEQLVAGSVIVQLPSPLTVMLPLGVPLPGAFTLKLTFTVYGCPTTLGSGAIDKITVVVSALLTVWLTAVDSALAAKLALPR